MKVELFSADCKLCQRTEVILKQHFPRWIGLSTSLGSAGMEAAVPWSSSMGCRPGRTQPGCGGSGGTGGVATAARPGALRQLLPFRSLPIWGR